MRVGLVEVARIPDIPSSRPGPGHPARWRIAAKTAAGYQKIMLREIEPPKLAVLLALYHSSQQEHPV
ncbi:MAG: hypothetical protein AAF206_28870, partial [Bacteroidota bacterium]